MFTPVKGDASHKYEYTVGEETKELSEDERVAFMVQEIDEECRYMRLWVVAMATTRCHDEERKQRREAGEGLEDRENEEEFGSFRELILLLQCCSRGIVRAQFVAARHCEPLLQGT